MLSKINKLASHKLKLFYRKGILTTINANQPIENVWKDLYSKIL